MTGIVILGKDIEKIQKVLREYFDKRMSSPDAIAIDWITLPSYLQEPFFEMCLAYIERLADKDDVTSQTLRTYRDTAIRMRGAANE